MVNFGIAHGCNHNKHFVWCYDFAGRVEVIKTSKPLAEQPGRLKMFFLFPEDGLPAALREAVDEGNKLRDKGNKLRDKGDKLIAESDKLRGEGKKLIVEGDKLVEKAISENMPTLLALHDELCPDCTWDGKEFVY